MAQWGGFPCGSPCASLLGKGNESMARGGGARESNRGDTVKVCCMHVKTSQRDPLLHIVKMC